jgi:hypothetical protein
VIALPAPPVISRWLLVICAIAGIEPLPNSEQFGKVHARKRAFDRAKRTFLSFKRAFFPSKRAFPRAKRAFVSVKRAFLSLIRAFPPLKHVFLSLKRAFLSLKRAFYYGSLAWLGDPCCDQRGTRVGQKELEGMLK